MGCEQALGEVLGQVRLDAQLAGEDAVALGVRVAHAVPVLGGDLAVGALHRPDDLADEFLLVGKRPLQVHPVANVGV